MLKLLVAAYGVQDYWRNGDCDWDSDSEQYKQSLCGCWKACLVCWGTTVQQ